MNGGLGQQLQALEEWGVEEYLQAVMIVSYTDRMVRSFHIVAKLA